MDGNFHYNPSTGTVTATAFTGTATVATLANTVVVVDSTDTTSFIAMFDSATGDLAAKTDGALKYNAGTGELESTLIKATTAVVPDESDGASLGTDALEWADLFLADGAVVSFGDDQEVTLTHVHNTGLLLSDNSGIGTTQLQFGDSGTYIHQSADGVLDLVADGEIELTAPALDLNGALDVSGTSQLTGNVTMSGDLDVDGTTNLDAVDIDGAVQVDAAVTVGVDDTGYDVKFFGATASAYMLWDASTDDLVLAGAAGIDLAGDLDVDGTANLDVVDIDGAVDMASTLTLAGNADFNGDLDVDGTTNLDVVDIDGAVDMASTLTVATDVIIGTNPAQAGDIRLNKNFGIFTRNHDNDANKAVVTENTYVGNDTLDFGDNAQWAGGIRFHCNNGGAAGVVALTSTLISLNKATTMNNAAIKMTGLATSDPNVAGQLWNDTSDGNTVKVSAG
jgi:cytoskeletal protein CcmA (bactofilin family)